MPKSLNKFLLKNVSILFRGLSTLTVALILMFVLNVFQGSKKDGEVEVWLTTKVSMVLTLSVFAGFLSAFSAYRYEKHEKKIEELKEYEDLKNFKKAQCQELNCDG